VNLPLVLGHAGEEVLYVLIPVALILWLRNVAARRAERDRGPAESEPDAKTPSDSGGTDA